MQGGAKVRFLPLENLGSQQGSVGDTGSRAL